MALLARIRSWFSASNLSTHDLVRELMGRIYPDSQSGIAVTPDSALRTSTVFACVRVLAETEAQLPFPLYRRREDGGKERETDHWLHGLLNERPNLWQTAFEWREMMMGHVVLRGNAYSYINRLPSNGRITELIPLHPGCMEVEQLPNTRLAYTYRPPEGGEHRFRQEQIFHLRGISSNGIVGLSPIEAYRESVGLAQAAERHQGRSFRQGVKFHGYLTSERPITDENALRHLRETFESLHSGDNAFKTPLLTGGMDWKSVGMTAKDAELISTRKFQREEIASIFRVPPHKIGDLERSTNNNIEHQSIEFVTDSMLPWLRRWEQAVWRDLVPADSKGALFAEHLVDGLLRGDIESRYKAYAIAVLNGWMNRNEVRIRENLNPVDGLEEFLTPLNMQQGTADRAAADN